MHLDQDSYFSFIHRNRSILHICVRCVNLENFNNMYCDSNVTTDVFLQSSASYFHSNQNEIALNTMIVEVALRSRQNI